MLTYSLELSMSAVCEESNMLVKRLGPAADKIVVPDSTLTKEENGGAVV